MDFPYSRLSFLTKNENFDRKNLKSCQKWRPRIWKIHLPTWYKMYNQWLWVSYAPLIQSEALSKVIYFLWVAKTSTLNPFLWKKVLKIKKVALFDPYHGNYGCARIVSFLIPMCKCASPQIHIYHLNRLIFFNFWLLGRVS